MASAGDLRKVTRSIFKRLDLSEEVRLEVSCSHSKQSSITSSIAFRLWRLCLKLENLYYNCTSEVGILSSRQKKYELLENMKNPS